MLPMQRNVVQCMRRNQCNLVYAVLRMRRGGGDGRHGRRRAGMAATGGDGDGRRGAARAATGGSGPQMVNRGKTPYVRVLLVVYGLI